MFLPIGLIMTCRGLLRPVTRTDQELGRVRQCIARPAFFGLLPQRTCRRAPLGSCPTVDVHLIRPLGALPAGGCDERETLGQPNRPRQGPVLVPLLMITTGLGDHSAGTGGHRLPGIQR